MYIQQLKTISEQVRTSHYTFCNAEYIFKNVYGKRTDIYACSTDKGKMSGNKFICTTHYVWESDSHKLYVCFAIVCVYVIMLHVFV